MHGPQKAFERYCRGEAKPFTNIYFPRQEMGQQKKAAEAIDKVVPFRRKGD